MCVCKSCLQWPISPILDPPQIRTSIFGGMSVSLAMFLLWEAAVMGSSGSGSGGGVGLDPLAALQAASPVAGPLIQAFSFFAVATSFIAFAYSLSDFIGDALQLRATPPLIAPPPDAPPRSPSGKVLPPPSSSVSTQQPALLPEAPPARPLLYLLSLAPPLLFAELNPSGFLAALDYAGTYGVMSLFGVLPAVLAWQQRLQAGGEGGEGGEGGGGLRMVPGGTPVLAGVGAVASGIILNQAAAHIQQVLELMGPAATVAS